MMAATIRRREVPDEHGKWRIALCHKNTTDFMFSGAESNDLIAYIVSLRKQYKLQGFDSIVQ